MITKKKKYEYKTLIDIYKAEEENNQDQQLNSFHFYALIITATNPRKSEDGFRVNLAVTDDSFSIENNSATIFINSNSRDKLPVITKMGMIIRVHRALKIINKEGKLNFNMNLHNYNRIESSWLKRTIFKCISKSSESFNFREEEESIISNMSKWSYDLFLKPSSIVMEFVNNLSGLSNNYQNVVVRINSKEIIGNTVVLVVEDHSLDHEVKISIEQDSGFCNCANINQGDICHIRSISKGLVYFYLEKINCYLLIIPT